MSSPAHIALNAHLLSGEASYRSAGIHGYIYNTLAHLPEVDPDLSYTVFVGAGRLPDRAGSGWEVRRSRLPTQHPVARIVWEQLLAPLEMAQVQPDLFHGMAFAAPVLWNGPSVVTVYDLSFLRYPERLGRARRLYLRWATASSVRRARRVIAISESGRQELCQLMGVPVEKIDLALPGVAPYFKPLPAAEVAAFRAEHNLPERFILYLGTLEPRKNLATLLHAYAKLPQRGAVKLVLAGGQGWQVAEIFALIEQLDLKQDVLLPGFIPNDRLPLWYNAAETFVYPSVYEGFGLPLLEAMACGIPVVASDTTSLPEAVGAAGILVPPVAVEQWVDALAHLLDDRDRRQALSRSGQVRSRSFTWEGAARQIVDSYRRALRK